MEHRHIHEGSITGHIHPIMEHSHSINIPGIYGTALEAEEFTSPFDVIEEDCKKLLVYKAAGFNKDMLEVKENWHNKEKKMYIDIYGLRYFGEGKKEKINIHIFLDTEVYEGYGVQIKDGLIIVTLHERINTPPEIKRVDV